VPQPGREVVESGVTILGLIVFELPVPDGLRLLLLVLVTLGLILPAYGAFVRHTAIGRVLHGPRNQTQSQTHIQGQTPVQRQLDPRLTGDA